MEASDFEAIYNPDGTCHQWDCGQTGVVLAYDDFSPEVALWFCAQHWQEYEDSNLLLVVEDKRRGKTMIEPTSENLAAFVCTIADGKLLMRFSHMTGCVTCDCCNVDEQMPIGGPDELAHKPWCIVVAARAFFPDFMPSNYPEDTIEGMRRWGSHEHNGLPQFAWYKTEITEDENWKGNPT